MTEENSARAVALELERSEDAHRAALLLRSATLFNDALNRLYYSLFHALTALLLTIGVEPRRHRAMGTRPKWSPSRRLPSSNRSSGTCAA